MSALSYSIDQLLLGKYYASRDRNLDGTIVEAIHDPELFYENAEAYRIRVRPMYLMHTPHKPWRQDFWATICVSTTFTD